MADPAYAERKAPKTAPLKDRPVESVRIQRAENGFTVSCTHPPKPSKKNEIAPWEPDKSYVFESVETMLAFVEKVFGSED